MMARVWLKGIPERRAPALAGDLKRESLDRIPGRIARGERLEASVGQRSCDQSSGQERNIRSGDG